MAEQTTAAAPQTLPKSPIEVAISDNEVIVTDLPQDVQGQITYLKLRRGVYLKNPTKNLYEEIVKKEVLIAEAIEDWAERNLPDAPSDEEDAAEEVAAAKVIADKAAEEQAKKDAEAKAAKDKAAAEEQAKKDAEAAAAAKETEFAKIIEANGRIGISELCRIMKKTTAELQSQEVCEGVKLNRGFGMIEIMYYYPTKI